MNVFAERDLQFWGSELPLWCPVNVAFPEAILTQKQEKSTWKPEDVIAFMNKDIYGDPSIDLASMFLRARETEQSPSFEERNTVEQFALSCKSDVQTLNSKVSEKFHCIMKLCQEASEVTSQISRKLDQVNIIRYILSPPEHLPHDVLEQIFFCCWKSIELSDPRAHLIPIQLARVCHRWRSVALSMPLLWSRIQVVMNDKESVHIAKLFISRARSPCLTLKLKKDQQISIAEDFVGFLNGLSIHFPRLSVELMEDYLPRGLVPFVERHTSNAEELVLTRTYDLQNLDVPKVKRLYVNGLPKSWILQPELSQFPQLSHLTILRIGWIIPPHVLDIILNRCPQLLRLRVDPHLKEGANNPSVMHLQAQMADIQVHGHLEYLCISHAGCGDVPQQFLHNWCFPKLQLFDYGVRSPYEASSSQWLLNHSLPSSIRLLIVHFPSGDHDPDIFLSILRAAPRLESLVLCGDSEVALTSLAENANTPLALGAASPVRSSTFSSKLERIHVVFTGDTDFVARHYGSQLQRLYAASLPTQLTHLIIEVSFRRSTPNKDDISSFISYVKNETNRESDQMSDSTQMPCLELQTRWRLGEGTTFLGRFWPLPFDQDEPKFGILSDKGVLSTRSGSAYDYD